MYIYIYIYTHTINLLAHRLHTDGWVWTAWIQSGGLPKDPAVPYREIPGSRQTQPVPRRYCTLPFRIYSPIDGMNWHSVMDSLQLSSYQYTQGPSELQKTLGFWWFRSWWVGCPAPSAMWDSSDPRKHMGLSKKGGAPIAGWFMSGKISSRSGWWLGVPPWLWKPPSWKHPENTSPKSAFQPSN